MNERDTAVGDRMMAFAEEVSPYFDSLLIIGTYRDKEITKTQILEKGNTYALEGSAMAYLDGELDPTDEDGKD